MGVRYSETRDATWVPGMLVEVDGVHGIIVDYRISHLEIGVYMEGEVRWFRDPTAWKSNMCNSIVVLGPAP